MGREYPNPLGTGMRFNFSSSLGMGRVMGKYMGVGDGDGEGKTCPHPAPLPCLRFIYYSWPHFFKTSVLARCWTRCLDMLVQHHNVPCFTFLEDYICA